MCARGRSANKTAKHQVPAGVQRAEWGDLQSAARRYCRTGRSPRRAPNHRNKQPKRGGCTTRKDRQPASDISRRDSHENHAYFDVSATNGSGEPCLHLSRHPGTYYEYANM